LPHAFCAIRYIDDNRLVARIVMELVPLINLQLAIQEMFEFNVHIPKCAGSVSVKRDVL